jgi:hypothetical protein
MTNEDRLNRQWYKYTAELNERWGKYSCDIYIYWSSQCNEQNNKWAMLCLTLSVTLLLLGFFIGRYSAL